MPLRWKSTCNVLLSTSLFSTKNLNLISILILFLNSLSAIWTDFSVLTLALFIFIHCHFHYSFIFISFTAVLFYGLTLTGPLRKLSYLCSSFCWHFKSSFTIHIIIHFLSSHNDFILVLHLICFMRKLPLPLGPLQRACMHIYIRELIFVITVCLFVSGEKPAKPWAQFVFG
jgi:hypothetical protein